MISRLVLFWALYAFIAVEAEAKQYPIFDGQFYNGVYYPRVDIIEWGNPPHLEFHIYSKKEEVIIEAKAIDWDGRRVLLVNYTFPGRKEKLCRSVLAPANFLPDGKLYLYKDSTDVDYDNIYVSIVPMKITKKLDSYASDNFSKCLEPKKEAPKKRAVASAPATLTNKHEGSSLAGPASNRKKTKPKDPKGELIDYENNAIPFNF